jgi:hypothetical protein
MWGWLTRRCRYTAGRILARLGRIDDERALYAGAVAERYYFHPQQRPMLLLPGLGDAPSPSAEVLTALAPTIVLLERNAAAIRAELVATGALGLATEGVGGDSSGGGEEVASSTPPNGASIISPAPEGFITDKERLSGTSALWVQGVLVRGGRSVPMFVSPSRPHLVRAGGHRCRKSIGA